MIEFAEKFMKFPAYYIISSTRALLEYSPNARVLKGFSITRLILALKLFEVLVLA